MTDSDDNSVTIARPKGYYYEVKAGKRYLWCSCGRSNTQPFCDGSHVGTKFLPVLFKAQADEDVIFCGCKHTGTPPFCDGAHSNLPGGYRLDDPQSAQNLRVRTVAADSGPIVRLDGACYVFSTSRATLVPRGVMSYTAVISPAMGALFQSQFYAEVTRGTSPVVSADGRHTVLFVSDGLGEVEISGRRFSIAPNTGVYIRPSEAYRIHVADSGTLKLFISNGPGSEDLVWLDHMPNTFDLERPQRRAQADASKRQAMAERYYQVLVNRDHGSTVVTQFIGTIPLSKAEPHQHLYEEAMVCLTGHGVVWTERTKTAIVPGDVLFLPRKQVHSVQCTTPGGFDLVGVIYPGDNPSINY
jgi:CDGSH-type Zn-finger protein/quercetin dioxygenase-like cupin family protein